MSVDDGEPFAQVLNAVPGRDGTVNTGTRKYLGMGLAMKKSVTATVSRLSWGWWIAVLCRAGIVR